MENILGAHLFLKWIPLSFLVLRMEGALGWAKSHVYKQLYDVTKCWPLVSQLQWEAQHMD